MSDSASGVRTAVCRTRLRRDPRGTPGWAGGTAGAECEAVGGGAPGRPRVGTRRGWETGLGTQAGPRTLGQGHRHMGRASTRPSLLRRAVEAEGIPAARHPLGVSFSLLLPELRLPEHIPRQRASSSPGPLESWDPHPPPALPRPEPLSLILDARLPGWGCLTEGQEAPHRCLRFPRGLPLPSTGLRVAVSIVGLGSWCGRWDRAPTGQFAPAPASGELSEDRR